MHQSYEEFSEVLQIHCFFYMSFTTDDLNRYVKPNNNINFAQEWKIRQGASVKNYDNYEFRRFSEPNKRKYRKEHREEYFAEGFRCRKENGETY